MKTSIILIGAVISTSPLAAYSATSNAITAETGFYFHLGATDIKLTTRSDEFNITELSTASSLALEEGPVEGSGTAVIGDMQPTLTVGYRFKRIPNLSFETAIAPPFEFGLKLTGTARDESLAPFALCPTEDTSQCLATGIPALGENLGSTQALPAVATFVYRLPAVWRFQPYIGAGAVKVITFDPEISNEVLTETGKPTLEISSELSPLLQIGFNARLTEKLTLVIDAKYTSDVAVNSSISDIELLSPTLGDVLGPAGVQKANLDAELDSEVYTIAFRYKF